MQHKILLLDELGDKWGNTHIYHDLRTPGDAIRLLCINYPDFAKYLATSHEEGIHYQVTQVDQELDYGDLLLPLGKHDLVIAPVIAGSKGVVKAIVGVGIILATGGFGAGAGGALFGASVTAGTTAAAIVAIGSKIGFALLLSGVSDMLAPQMSSFDPTIKVGAGGYLSGPSSMEKGADGVQSYAYSGAANTVGIGKTIPIVYGEAITGSHLISSNIDVVDSGDPLMTAFEAPHPRTCRVNGNEIKLKNNSLRQYNGLKATRVSFGKKVKNYQGRALALTKSLINLNSKGKQRICTSFRIDGSGEFNAENMMIMIDFVGINDRIGGSGSTLIHGFITFKVIVETANGENTLLNQQLTVQGIMKFTQKIRYVFGFDPVPIDGDDLKVFIQIVDKELLDTSKTKMRVQRLGYKFFKGGFFN